MMHNKKLKQQTMCYQVEMLRKRKLGNARRGNF